jgi:hypothetical protein
MKKLLSIIILGLLWFVPIFADEYNWKKIVKKNTPNINLYLGDSLIEKSKEPLFDKLIKNMMLSHQMPEIDDKYYFLKAGCKVHSCPEKGVVWIDKNKEIFIGLVVHKYFEDVQVDESISWFDIPIDYLFFSSSIDSFEDIPKQFWIHFDKLETLMSPYGYGNPEKIRFIGNSKIVKDVTDKYYKK